jgi:iron(III) transport system substrate-binding protein
MKRKLLAGAAIALAIFARTATAQADNLTLYCSVDEAWCQMVARAFEEQTGIKVAMTRKSSGETFAQVKAEAANPKGDIWWGGTGDPHLQAAERPRKA